KQRQEPRRDSLLTGFDQRKSFGYQTLINELLARHVRREVWVRLVRLIQVGCLAPSRVDGSADVDNVSSRRGQADELSDVTLPVTGPRRARSSSAYHRATAAPRVAPQETHAGLPDRPAFAAQRTDGSPSKRAPATSRCRRTLPTA